MGKLIPDCIFYSIFCCALFLRIGNELTTMSYVTILVLNLIIFAFLYNMDEAGNITRCEK